MRNPNQDELSIAYNAIRDFNLQKFTKLDSIMFENIMRDIFPDQANVKHEDVLEKYIIEVMKEENLDHNPEIVQKIF